MIRRRSCTWLSLTSSRSSSLACSGFLVRDDRLELVGETAEGGTVGRCVRLCGEPGGEVGFSFAEDVEAVTVATDAFLEEVGGEPSVFEAFEVAFQLALDARDLGACRCELILQVGPFALGRIRQVSECSLDQMAIAVELSELGETAASASSREIGAGQWRVGARSVAPSEPIPEAGAQE